MSYREFKKVYRIDTCEKESRSRLISSLQSCIPLTPDQEFELFEKYIKTRNPEYKDKLIKANLRFVFSVARKFDGIGVPLEDLFQEGCIGLTEAVDKFDPTKGFKFISYAVNYIQMEMLNVIQNHAGMISLPSNVGLALSKIVKFKEQFFIKNERYPTHSEIIEGIGGDKLSTKSAFLVSTIDRLENPVGDNQTYEDVLGVSEFDDYFSINYNSIVVAEMLSHLEERSKDIIESYFGIGKDPESLLIISFRYNLTRERTRQILVKELRNLGIKYKCVGNNTRFM